MVLEPLSSPRQVHIDNERSQFPPGLHHVLSTHKLIAVGNRYSPQQWHPPCSSYQRCSKSCLLGPPIECHGGIPQLPDGLSSAYTYICYLELTRVVFSQNNRRGGIDRPVMDLGHQHHLMMHRHSLFVKSKNLSLFIAFHMFSYFYYIIICSEKRKTTLVVFVDASFVISQMGRHHGSSTEFPNVPLETSRFSHLDWSNVRDIPNI